MGRPRKPAAARAREGGTARAGAISHRPQPSTELVAVAGRDVPIAAPLDLPEPARELWAEIVAVLAHAGIVDRIDLPMLRWLCVTHARGRQAQAVIDEPVTEEELEQLERQTREMQTLADALKSQVANMMRAGLDVPPAKINALTNYEQTLANLRELHRARRIAGNLVTLGSTGQLVEHPLASTERAAAALVLRYASRFGLTPADRAQLGLQILEGRTMKRDLENAIGPAAKRPD
jgi:phage terminase small subunit